tara:strand:+ start:129 stop:1088 length:960 start_codon:yes stop_codon:yes gene_type:complete
MKKYTKNLLLNLKDNLLNFRNFIKLNIFKSPMSEVSSIKYAFYNYASKFFFKLNNKLKLILDNEANQFNKNGFTTFTNINIEKKCTEIFNKLKKNNNYWGKNKKLKYPPSDIFRDELISIFNSGVDQFIKNSFKSDYYIFYHILYKSNRSSKLEIPEGSELWHADGGPGICMNLMICHTPINKSNGAMKIINWHDSKKLLSKLFFENKKLLRNKNIIFPKDIEKRLFLRQLKCEILKKQIENNSIKFYQPKSNKPGTIFAFRNNCVHAGGFTELGYERIVSVMHIYPSIRKTSLIEKFNSPHLKFSGYPNFDMLIKNKN